MESIAANAFANALERIRESRNYNRQDFAKAIGFDRAGYYVIISGKRPGHKFVNGVLQLETLTEAEKKQLLQAYLQWHLDQLDTGSQWKVQLRSTSK